VRETEVIRDQVAREHSDESKDERGEDASLMVTGDKLSDRPDYERDDEKVS